MHVAVESSKPEWKSRCAAAFSAEPGAVYEVKLVAYNGNGESDGSARLVSLVEEKTSDPSSGEGDF